MIANAVDVNSRQASSGFIKEKRNSRKVWGERNLVGSALGGEVPRRVPQIVVVDTGWASRFGTDAALEHPALDPDAAAELLRRGMRLLAVDTLSPDPTGGDGFPVHDVVLGGDALIVENLTGLEGLPERVRIGFFPLPIDADGAPVRAVAFTD